MPLAKCQFIFHIIWPESGHYFILLMVQKSNGGFPTTWNSSNMEYTELKVQEKSHLLVSIRLHHCKELMHSCPWENVGFLSDQDVYRWLKVLYTVASKRGTSHYSTDHIQVQRAVVGPCVSFGHFGGVGR